LTTICRWLLAAALLAGCDSGPKFRSTDITGAPYGKALELSDAQGKPRRLEDFRGKVLVLFFGFTRCPDVCPTTLAEVAAAAPATSAMPVVAANRICSGTMPGVASSMPITAVNTISDTTRGLVSARKERARSSQVRAAVSRRSSVLKVVEFYQPKLEARSRR